MFIKKIRLSYKITAMAISMVLICSASVGLFMYRGVSNDLYRLKGTAAQAAASTLAAAFDYNEILKLHREEKENPYYYYLKRAISTAGQHTAFELLFVITEANNGRDYKVIYAQSGSGNYCMELGYTEPKENLNAMTGQVFETGKDAYTRPYYYSDGRFMMTGYSPIFDDDKNVVAIVGMDISVEDVKADLARTRQITFLFVALFVISFSIISIIYTKKSIGDPISALSRMSNRLVEGDLDYDAHIKSNDEIGLLYENFKKMQSTIRDLLDALSYVANEQKGGDIDALIDAEMFSGAYKSVALSVNDFISDLCEDVLDILSSLQAVSSGEFDTKLATRPGKKIIANQIFESVKKTLSAVYLGISVLVKNTADGELFEGEEVSQYSGDWGPLMSKIVRFHLQAEKQRQIIVEGISYAAKIQKSLLPVNAELEQAFEDYSVIWKPRDIVGGDIYWLKSFKEGTVLCVCDCTGHGTPGALLTMLVVSALESIVNESNCTDTAEIIWGLEQRLVSVFSVNSESRKNGGDAAMRDGCDLAVLYISKEKSITISSGHINVFVCDGKEVTRYKGQNIFIGEGKLKGKDDVLSVKIPDGSDKKFYIASDGLFDQMGGTPARPFGYKRFTKLILESHSETQPAISGKVWEAFEDYRGKQPRRDDFELITFKL